MPDQSVEVTFDPNANPQFTFVPDTVTMTKAGKIVIHRRPHDAPWTFRGAKVEDDGPPGQFSVSLHANDTMIHIRDEWTDGERESHKYTVTVRFEWNNHFRDYESPDPVIVNDPGSRDVALVEEKRKPRRGDK
jgi:hypothetical protein